MSIKCPHCEHDGNVIEMSSKIYFDVDEGTVMQDDTVIITAFSHSHLNDEVGDFILNIEAELFVGCAACGHEFVAEFDVEPVPDDVGMFTPDELEDLANIMRDEAADEGADEDDREMRKSILQKIYDA